MLPRSLVEGYAEAMHWPHITLEPRDSWLQPKPPYAQLVELFDGPLAFRLRKRGRTWHTVCADDRPNQLLEKLRVIEYRYLWVPCGDEAHITVM